MTAFYWECDDFRLAVAPWRSDPRQQRVVHARVAVAEQRTPGFALRFDLEVEKGAEKLAVDSPLMRLVNQRQMLEAFEFAFVGSETENRRPPGGEGDEELDRRLKQWLAGGGHVQAPPKEELAKWLLGWMLITTSEEQADEWVVLLCGEKGAGCCTCGEDWEDMEAGDANEPPVKDNGEDDDCNYGDNDDDDNSEDEGDLPPPYEEQVELRLGSVSDEDGRGDVRPSDNTRLKDTSSARELTKRQLPNRSGSSRSLSSSTVVSSKEKSELKLTIVQLNPRLDSLHVVNYDEEPSNEWSQDRRRFHQQLHSTRRDVQAAKHRRDKAEELARLRHSQLLKDSARKLRANDQKRRDAQAVRQLIADTLEHRDELNAMESRTKQKAIAAHRDQERVKRLTRVVMGNIEKTSSGTVRLGPGPPSRKEMELLRGDTRSENTVYDLHGRRRNLEEAGLIATESALESGMRKVRRLVLRLKSIETFRRYDLDRRGTLNYEKFQRLLRDIGTGDSAELTPEQSSALFKRFAADNSGVMNYGELLWEFFNWEAFLKKWSERKSAAIADQTERELKQAFKRYDPTCQGVLPLKEFQLVMDHLGVNLGDVDANLLAVKFDGGMAGYIDYHNFLSYVNLSLTDDKTRSSASSETILKSTCTAQSSAPPGMERIWKELQSLTATQARLHRLLQK